MRRSIWAAVAAALCLSAPLAFAQEQVLPQAPPAAAASTIRVQVLSLNEVELSSEIAAKIAALPLREGDAFHKGETLISLDCSLSQAQLRKAEADAEAAEELLKVDRRLVELHSVGELQVAQADAKAKAAAADVAYMGATVRDCTIAAPFDGRVAKRAASPGQFVEPGKPILTVVDTGHLELKMIVPSSDLSWLKVGHPLSVRVDETGKSYPARVVRIGADVDPVTQTIDVMAALTEAAPELLPGMSGSADLGPGG